MSDTIYAPATVPGKSAVAIIRLSGPRAFDAARRLARGLPPARTAGLRRLRDPDSGETLDQAVILTFPAPASFTGEDCVELQTHGSGAVLAGVLAALGRLESVRLAEPGEFTRRALMNARLDLAQVEGLGDLLAAETAAQRRQALELMEGALSRRVAAWRAALMRVLALIEASIDFADEELPPDLIARAADELGETEAAMRRELEGATARERLRDGFEVALVGLPNVGKSTLINRLAERELALVAEEAGTTRDVLEARLDLRGLPVTILDMAGLRDATGVEGAGVERARTRAAAADLRVFLVENEADVTRLGVAVVAGDIVARAKGDLTGSGVSGRTGQGVRSLLEEIRVTLSGRVGQEGTIAHARQRQAAGRAAEALASGAGSLRDGALDLAAEEVRAALRSLDFLLGRVDVEAVLDIIFASFCLGK